MSYSFNFNKLTNVKFEYFSIHKGNYHLSKYKLSRFLVNFGGDEIVDKIMVYINNMERSLGVGRLYFYLKSGINTSSTNINHFGKEQSKSVGVFDSEKDLFNYLFKADKEKSLMFVDKEGIFSKYPKDYSGKRNREVKKISFCVKRMSYYFS